MKTEPPSCPKRNFMEMIAGKKTAVLPENSSPEERTNIPAGNVSRMMIMERDQGRNLSEKKEERILIDK
jgi:hypothetical protein